MKHLKNYLIFICLLLGSLNTAFAAYDAGDGSFYLKTSDGHEEYTVNGTVTFKCVKSGTIPGYRDAGVTFAPANPGELIHINVETIDLDGANNYLLLYNGYIRTGYSNASTSTDCATTNYMPCGYFAQIGSAAVGNEYTSESEDGKLTIGFHSSSANSQMGFTITVTSLSPKDMEFVSAGVFSDNASVNRGGRNRVLLGANLTMDGGGNPHTLNELVFNTSAFSAAQIENLRLYSSATFTEANLLATSPTVGTNISYNGDITLRNGDNKFYLVADVKPNASGIISSATLTSVKINNEAKAISPAAANSQAIANTILIGKEHLTYTISENANFYDDGGTAGKITSNFDGTITFVPATEGKKIKIDFSTLEIFNTSSTGYNDVFKFYNGQTVDEDKLITTLLKDAEIVKSTADDGSITVTLKSTTGVPANGWEAVVSEFVSSDMTLESLTATQALTTTLAAGSTDEPFILFNVKTNNTLSPLEVQEININATGTSRLNSLANAKVYFLGKNATFNTNTLFGQLTGIDNANISITGNQELIEGNNYFALVYALAEGALNNEVIAAALTGVKLSGTTATPAEAATAQRTVANIFRATGGTHNITLYDDWTYTDTKSTISPTKYEYVNEDRIVTFTPNAAGAVAEIDFSSFDVYYNNSIYGEKAVFEIYSGQTVNGGNLLWKLDDNAKSTTGPGRILRSTAADGSMTIKFNANVSSSYYASTGWVAAVRSFINHNMTIEEINVFQNNSNNLRPASSNQEIIGFNIQTAGTLSTQKVKEVKIDLKDSESLINKVSLFYTAAENNFSQAVLFGSTTDVSAQEVSITGEQALPEGISYFWLAYDIKGDAAADAQVDAALLSVKTEDETPYTPANGNPDGNRIIKNTIELTNGNNGLVTLTQPVKFYDEGGANEDYRNVSTFPFDGKITFLPAGEGEAVKIEFSKMDVTNTNYLYIYEGTEVDESKLVATIKGYYSSTTSPGFPQPIISASPDGALTVRFAASTRPTISYEGWEADVYSYAKSALYVEDIITTQVGTAEIMRGSADAAVQQIKIVVKGDYDELTLSNFNFTNGVTTNAGDITKAALYYTGISTATMLGNQVGENASVSPYSFTADENIIIDKAGSYYFYLAYDVKADATPGNIIGASLTGISVNGTVNSDITESSAVSRSVKSGLQGEYVIGSSDEADYATFAAAIVVAKDGIEGPVVFNIEAGTYNEAVLVSAIPGTSAVNTITFTSLSGNNDDVMITGTNNSAYVFKVEQTPYVVLENVSLKPNFSIVDNHVVYVTDQSRYFTLRNCVLEAKVSTYDGTHRGTNLVRVQGLDQEGKNCDYFTAEGNTFIGGYVGVYMYGTGYVSLTKQKGAVIRDNTLINQYTKGIYVPDEQDALVENNTISCSTSEFNGYCGIDINRTTGQVIVRNNTINLSNTTGGYSKGMWLRSGTSGVTGTQEKHMLIYNNSISIVCSNNGQNYGIEMNVGSSDVFNYIDFYHNSINLSGTYGTCFVTTSTSVNVSDIVFQNNLLQNNATDGRIYSFTKAEHYRAFTFSNNAYYLASATETNFASLAGIGTTFEDWTTASGEENSIVEQAQFITSTDLHLMEQGGLNAALPVDYITTDADGNLRNATTPTIGAYEYETIVIITPEIEETYPKTGTITYNSIQFKTKWNQSGNLYGIIKEASEEAPTKEDLLATTAVNLNSGTEHTSLFTALEEETDYKAYFIFVSAFDVESAIVTSETATTVKQIFPLQVTLASKTIVTAGEQATITPVVTGSVAPYTFEWKDKMNNVISNETALTESPSVSHQYKLTVTGSDGQSQTLYADVWVRGEAAVATFEDNQLDEESYRYHFMYDNSEISIGTNYGEDEVLGAFYSGSYSFANSYTPAYGAWGGYAYSNVTATIYAGAFDHQFRSVTGYGAENSNAYAVVYDMGYTTIEVTHAEEGMTIPGVYLTNAAWTYSSLTEGGAIEGAPFGAGDYYEVTFKGNTGTSVTYPLADYRSDNAAEHYILTDWKWFDLSPLGNITSLTVSVDGSRKSGIYLDTPAYLCMDNLGASKPSISITGNSMENTDNLLLYPVPTYDVLNIAAPYSDYSVEIYNIYGQLVKTCGNLSWESEINISNLPTGNYLIKVSSQEASITRSLIKK